MNDADLAAALRVIHREVADPVASPALRARVLAITATRSQRPARGWRLPLTDRRWVSVAIRLIAALAILSVSTGAVLFGVGQGPGPTQSLSPSPWAPPAGLMTQPIEPGVERVVSDDAGHDFDSITDLAFGPDGAIWMLGSDGLFQVGEPGSYPGLPGDLTHEKFHDLTVASDGTLWATNGNNIASFADGTWTTHPGVWGVGALEVGRDGTVSALGSTMLGRLDGDSWSTFPLAEARAPMPAGRSYGGPGKLAMTPDGDVWVAFSVCQDLCVLQRGGGLARFDGTSWERVRPLGDAIDQPTLTLATGSDGSLWVYGETARQEFSDPMQPYFAHLVGDSWTVYGPAEGLPRVGHPGAWAGLMNVGVDGALWATSGDGLVVFDGKTWTVKRPPCCEEPQALVAAPDGNAWFVSNESRVYIVQRQGQRTSSLVP